MDSIMVDNVSVYVNVRVLFAYVLVYMTYVFTLSYDVPLSPSFYTCTYVYISATVPPAQAGVWFPLGPLDF